MYEQIKNWIRHHLPQPFLLTHLYDTIMVFTRCNWSHSCFFQKSYWNFKLLHLNFLKLLLFIGWFLPKLPLCSHIYTFVKSFSLLSDTHFEYSERKAIQSMFLCLSQSICLEFAATELRHKETMAILKNAPKNNTLFSVIVLAVYL